MQPHETATTVPLPAHMQGIMNQLRPPSSPAAPGIAPGPAGVTEEPETPPPTVVDRTSDADRSWAATGATAGAYAEAVAETPLIPVDSLAVPLADKIIHILDPMEWFDEANYAMQTGDFRSWAETSLAPGEFENVWCALNGGHGPRTREVVAMLDDWGKMRGIDPKAMPNSPASYRRTVTR